MNQNGILKNVQVQHVRHKIKGKTKKKQITNRKLKLKYQISTPPTNSN